MAPGTRSFTVDELNELEVTTHGDAVLLDEEHDKRRWYTYRRVVFKAHGQLWSVCYREPASEIQEDIEPFDDDPVIATLMEPYEITVTKYRPA